MAVNLVDLAETIENLTAEEKKALNILIQFTISIKSSSHLEKAMK